MRVYFDTGVFIDFLSTRGNTNAILRSSERRGRAPAEIAIDAERLFEIVSRAHIGTKLWNPEINYAKMAQAYGLYGEGPITDPKDLQAAFKRGIERVKAGEPALIDVVTQGR